MDPSRIRAWLRRHHGAAPGGRWVIDEATFAVLASSIRPGPRHDKPAVAPTGTGRATTRDEIYVIDLCDRLLGIEASRQHRFDWLVGDPGRDGRPRPLPVDAYYEPLGLVVEYRERQHDRPVPFFDKPGQLTVSGVHRGEQRRIYDRRSDTLIPAQGLRLWVITPGDLRADHRGRLTTRTQDRDLDLLRTAWDRMKDTNTWPR
jgi:hypothetical protein